jgi:hypothetical protein
MNDDTTLTAHPRPHSVDLALLVIGLVTLAAIIEMFLGSPWLLPLGIVAGCALGAIGWRWPRVMGIVLLVLSIPGMVFGLFLTYYTLGMPHALASLWG